MKYKIGDFVEMDTEIQTLGKIVNIENEFYVIRFRHGYIGKFKESEIIGVVKYKGVME